MQPKSEEELRQQLEVQMRRKRRKKSNKKDEEGDETDGAAAKPKTPTVSYPVPLDFYNSPRLPLASPTRRNKRDSVLNILDEARGEDGAMMVLTSPARARLNTSQVVKTSTVLTVPSDSMVSTHALVS